MTELLEVIKKSAQGQADSQENQSAQNMVLGCCNRIKLLACLSLQEAKMLYETIEACGVESNFKKDLRKAVESKLAMGNTNDADNVVLKPQMLTAIEKYMTHSEWQILVNPSSTYMEKMNTVVRRLKLVGVRSLHEQTAKFGVALLLSTLTTLPEYKLIHQMLCEFKQVFHRDTTKVQVPFVRNYPNNPAELPKSILEIAYTEDNPPCPKEIDTIAMIANNHVPVRNTSKLLTGGTKPKGAKEDRNPGGPASSSRSSVNAESMMVNADMNPLNQACMMLMNCMEKMQKFQQTLGTETKIQISPKKQKELEDIPKAEALASAAAAFKPSTRALALEDLNAKKEEKSEEQAQLGQTESAAKKEEEPEQKSAEKFEEAAFQALLARKEEKNTKNAQTKNKASAKGKAKAKAKAKGKTKGKQKVLKRPSAQGHCYEIPPWKSEDMKIGKNTYTSRHWHGANSFGKRVLGMNDEQAKLYAKKYREEAAQIFDKHKPIKKLKSKEIAAQ